ncbi:MAG: AAA domain-containing protein [Betaproteobacteria bacterium]
MTIQKRRLIALVDFAQQTLRTRSRVVSDVASYGGFLLFEQQARAVQGLRFDDGGADGDDEIWLAVPHPPNPQVPPQADSPWLSPWLNVGTALGSAPELAAQVDGTALIDAGTHRDSRGPATDLAQAADPATDPGARVLLSDYAFRREVETQHARYLEAVWRPWAEAEARRRQLAHLYIGLFTLQQELAGALVEGQLELVWGMGLCTSGPSGATVTYPLITRTLELSFDPVSQAAELRPRDSDPRLELEIFLSAQDAAVLADAEKQAAQFLATARDALSPFEADSYEPLLAIARGALEAAHARAPATAAGVFEITPGWVVFARPRSTIVAVQDLERFRDLLVALDEQSPLPEAAAALVSEPAAATTALALPSYRGVTAAYHAGGVAEPEETQDLFFPKPFNDEQARIVQMLEVTDGVVVQGPPGTGKTHTIANIICHWLANGRRVLVTSMREPALAVLREQLPAQIRPLALSLLAGAQTGVSQLEHSIRKIAAEVQSLDPSAAHRQVEGLLEGIDAFHGRLKRIDTDLGRWAKLNVTRIDLGGEIIDPQDAAAEVMRHAGQFEWLPDGLGVGPQYIPRFGADDVVRLREARRQLGPDIDYAGSVLPPAGELPDALHLVRAHDDLQRYAKVVREARSSELPVPAGSGAQSIIGARALAQQIARVKALRDEFRGLRLPWSDETIARMRSGEPKQLFDVLETLAADIRRAGEQRMQALERPVVVPDPAHDDAQFVQAVHNLAQGRRAFGLAVFGRPEAKKLLDLVRVNALRPADLADWKAVLAHLELHKTRRGLTARWNALAAEIGLQPVLSADATGRLSAESQLAHLARLRQLAQEEAALSRMAQALFPGWSQAALVHQNSAALAEVELALAFHLTKSQLGEVSAVVDGLHRALEGKRGKIIDRLREFLAGKLGDPAVDESALLAEWNVLDAELARLRALSAPLALVDTVTANIAASGAPKLAQQLRQRATGFDDKLTALTLLRDWRLRRLATHLQAIDAQDELKKLSAARLEVEQDLARAYEDLVVRRTWLKLTENVTPGVRAALQAYLNAIQRIGKGTGKRAFRYRRDARMAAALAQRAVPCWIMPHHRVSESLPSQLGSFDLVVIDEASQSDISALPVLLRARKILVVGDDKQVSPQAVGIEEERINALMHRHLGEQVPLYAAQMSPDRSIYDLAKVVFARNGVMLKEHFRCVAPIIEYSRREFYDNELHPLRLATASRRLDPPLLDYFIGDARRDGAVNRAEVEFIVRDIKALAADRKLQARSIGVVSLLGEEQALQIWERLTQELTPDLLRRHAIACGDARQFQGRERDIMYLSMVCASNNIGAPLARETFAQRFNVAASRARDRMVLVRSVEIDQLPESDRLRRGLIEHFARPFGAEPARVTDLRSLCESRIERDLFDWLNGEGYHVTPQVAVGAYRIDMVVEGRDDTRLAVECDGDKYQGPQQWIEDMRRQRTLQRVGWVFWRCFAGALLRRRQAVLEDLRRTLADNGIEPIGRGGWGRRRVTETRRVRAPDGAAVLEAGTQELGLRT